jgi:hypothetical protein
VRAKPEWEPRQMTIRSLTVRTTILAALGAAGLALVAASPAGAINRSYEPTSYESPTITRTVDSQNTTPVDENGKKSCQDKTGDYHPHGTTYVLTKIDSEGKGVTYTMKCNDGQWDGTWEPVNYTNTSTQYYDLSSATNYFEPAP